MIYLAVVVLILGSTPIVTTYLVKYLESHQLHLGIIEIKFADVIVFWGGMPTSVSSTQGVDFEWIDPDRFFGGVELALVHKAYYLMFSAENLPWKKSSSTESDF